MQYRLLDSTWTIVFKALIVIHIMIREGAQDSTLLHLAEHPKKIAINGFSERELKKRPWSSIGAYPD